MLIAQTHSGGIGIDLTASQTAVYYTRNWSLEDYLQSQDRLHRIGQTGTVNIIHLMSVIPGKEGSEVDYEADMYADEVPRKRKQVTVSIDQAIARSILRKQSMADLVTGDRVSKIEMDAIESILG
jgi:hypothetical protein